MSFASFSQQQLNWIKPLQQIIKQHYVHQHKADDINLQLAQRLPSNFKSHRDSLLRDLAITLREVSGDKNFDIKPIGELFTLDSTNKSQTTFPLGQPKASQGFTEIQYLENQIGYLKISHIYNNSQAQQRVVDLFNNIKPVNAFILDLTDTQGDSLAVAQALLNYFFNEEKHIAQLKFAQPSQSINLTVSGKYAHWQKNAGKELTMPVYVLTSAFTAGTAELIAFSLQYFDKALVIGKPTIGNTYITQEFKVNNQLSITLPTAQYSIDNTSANWQDSGVIPDINAQADSSKKQAVAHAQRFIVDQ